MKNIIRDGYIYDIYSDYWIRDKNSDDGFSSSSENVINFFVGPLTFPKSGNRIGSIAFGISGGLIVVFEI